MKPLLIGMIITIIFINCCSCVNLQSKKDDVGEKIEKLFCSIALDQPLKEIKNILGTPVWERNDIYPGLISCGYIKELKNECHYFLNIQALDDENQPIGRAILTNQVSSFNYETFMFDQDHEWTQMEMNGEAPGALQNNETDAFVKEQFSFIKGGMDISYIAYRLGENFKPSNVSLSSGGMFGYSNTDTQKKYSAMFRASYWFISSGTVDVIIKNKVVERYRFDDFQPTWIVEPIS